MDGAMGSGSISPTNALSAGNNLMKKLLVVLFSLTFAASIRAAIPPAENLLPSDTLFFFTAPDCTALRTAAHQSPQWMFWSDPAMKPFRDKFMAKWSAAFVAPLEHDLGVKLADFENLPQGQFTFAVTQNGWNGIDPDKSPGILLLLDAGDKSDLLTTNLDALKKKWADDGRPIHTETVRGIQFSIVPLSSNAIPPSLAGFFPKRQPVQELGKEPVAEKPGELVVGQFESLLIAGSSLEAVEPVAARLTGGAIPALSDNADFRRRQNFAISRRAAVLRLVQRQNRFQHARPDSRNAAESRSAKPDAANSVGQSFERIGPDRLEEREPGLPGKPRRHGNGFVHRRAGRFAAGNFQDDCHRAGKRRAADVRARRRGEILALAGGRAERLGCSSKNARRHLSRRIERA